MEGESPVITIRNAAATAKINVTKLRGNISVLEGSGGNIALLTGPNRFHCDRLRKKHGSV